ncbi:hypothetical protein ACRRTK_014718 [Alexandromys fortis]
MNMNTSDFGNQPHGKRSTTRSQCEERSTPSLATDALFLLTSTPLRGVKTSQSTRHSCTMGESLFPAWVGLPGPGQLRRGGASQA